MEPNRTTETKEERRLTTPLEGAALAWAQREHGICSDTYCDQPIAHVCSLCGKKVCELHAITSTVTGEVYCWNTPPYLNRVRTRETATASQ